ncbi:MAG: desulfoferrodoxin [Fusobacteriaceae bacterium]|jgi:superoxide reductase|nr:desulfoferrodoxin [Fusobacteriaceae bacterium]
MSYGKIWKEKGGKSVVEVVSRDFNEAALSDKFEALEEKSQDAAVEKHVPYVEETAEGYVVKVGKAAKHPMAPEHFIEFIEILVDGSFLYRKYLNPGEEPEALFQVPKGGSVSAREYCNVHGLWKNQ